MVFCAGAECVFQAVFGVRAQNYTAVILYLTVNKIHRQGLTAQEVARVTVESVMEVLKYIGMGILLVIDIVIIVCVLLQSSKSSGLSGLVSGGAETFFGKNKSQDMEAKLQRIVKIAGIIFIVLSIAITTLINRAGA